MGKRKYNKERENGIKANRAIRKLKKETIIKESGVKIRMLPDNELFKLYEAVFGVPITNRSRYETLNEYNGYIYIIGNLEHKVCKIGFSKNPQRRLIVLQTGSPYELSLFKKFIGNIPIEKKLHKKYKDYRLHGEWFEIRDELKEIILS